MPTDRLPLLDVNVLIALAWPQHVHHSMAHAWFGAVRRRSFATCALTETAFVRLSTNPKIVGQEIRFSDALGVLQRIRGLPGHRFVSDDTSLADPVINLERAVTRGQVTDLHLVNLAASAGAVLVTFDRAIATFLAEADRNHLHLLGTPRGSAAGIRDPRS